MRSVRDIGQLGEHAAHDPWEACARLATKHYENFTVGSLLLPRHARRHLWAVYAYCRTTDDIGDEAEGDRMRLLDAWEEELDACFAGSPRHPVTVALAETAAAYAIPKEPFWRLIEANRIDQRKREYQTFEELLEYCSYSANPVGRIVLALAGCADPRAAQFSDAVCTGLQLANFWQDIAVDLEKGRIYLPREDMDRFGYGPDALRAKILDERFRSLLKFQVDRTLGYFDVGEALIPLIPGRFKIDVALFGMGGRAILREIERQGFDVLSHRPTVSGAMKLRLLFKAILTHGPWRGR